MDLVVYNKNSKKVFLIFTDAKIDASSVMCEAKFKLEYVENYEEYTDVLQGGNIFFRKKKKESKGKIIYLDDYRKPY